jgi:hypothetical protein
MAKSWLLGQPAEKTDTGVKGIIVRTFSDQGHLMVVMQSEVGSLWVIDSAQVRVLATPKTN